MRWSAVVIVALVGVLAAPAGAHHSFGEIYFEDESIEIEGEIVEFQYVNPHAWVHVVAQEAFGKPKLYAAEWVSTSQLERQGIGKTTLRPGDVVRIWGSPARRVTDNRVHLKRIQRRSDGWEWRGRNVPR